MVVEEMREKKIALFNKNGELMERFVTQAEAIKFCVDNKICNAGWVTRSLKTGEKFYYPQERKSTIYNGYQGAGWYVKLDSI